MKLIWSVLTFVLIHLNVVAQENSLYFDGVDDNVTVANASALIAGSTQISLSFWGYPENVAPVFPDYDGFCGFRNDASADFYVVQISATSVEARFRNSSGAAFDLIDSTLQLNAWQHFVLTYNGSLLSLYHNNVLVDTASANGNISSTAETFNIGNLIYSFNNFYLQGKIDEVSLWNTALSPVDIQCMFLSYYDSASAANKYISYLDTSSANLLLYYRFNQGVPGGSNSGITTLSPDKGSLTGTLNNLTLTGPLSNFVDGLKNGFPLSGTICPGQNFTFGTQTLTAPGVYYEIYTSANGCDSIVRLNLLPEINDSVTNLSATTLHAIQNSATYQWINCADSSIIAGATNQDYSPANDGSYAVILNYNGCTDTSECVVWIQTGVAENNKADIIFYPNPFNDKINLYSLPLNSEIRLLDEKGSLIKSYRAEGDYILDVSFLVSGKYFLKINNNSAISILKN